LAIRRLKETNVFPEGIVGRWSEPLKVGTQGLNHRERYFSGENRGPNFLERLRGGGSEYHWSGDPFARDRDDCDFPGTTPKGGFKLGYNWGPSFPFDLWGKIFRGFQVFSPVLASLSRLLAAFFAGRSGSLPGLNLAAFFAPWHCWTLFTFLAGRPGYFCLSCALPAGDFAGFF